MVLSPASVRAMGGKIGSPTKDLSHAKLVEAGGSIPLRRRQPASPPSSSSSTDTCETHHSFSRPEFLQSLGASKEPIDGLIVSVQLQKSPERQTWDEQKSSDSICHHHRSLGKGVVSIHHVDQTTTQDARSILLPSLSMESCTDVAESTSQVAEQTPPVGSNVSHNHPPSSPTSSTATSHSEHPSENRMLVGDVIRQRHAVRQIALPAISISRGGAFGSKKQTPSSPPPPPPATPEVSALSMTPPTETSTAAATISPDKKMSNAIVTRIWSDFKDDFKELFSTGFTFWEYVFTAFTVAALALASSAMILEASLLVDVLAWMTAIMAPSAAVFHRKVVMMEGIKQATNDLRDQVDRMSQSNKQLVLQNKRLEQNARKLQNVAGSLAEISRANGMTVDSLLLQVEEYKRIQRDIKLDLKSKIQQTLLSVFIISDKDEDYMIDPEEVDRLVLRLNNIPGVKFNEDRFRRALQQERGDIVKFFENRFSDQDAFEKEQIFVF